MFPAPSLVVRRTRSRVRLGKCRLRSGFAVFRSLLCAWSASLSLPGHHICFWAESLRQPGTPCGVSSPSLFCFSVQKLWRESPILRGGIEHHASKRFLTARDTSVAPSRRILKGRRSCRARQAYSPQKTGRRLLNQVAGFYREPFFAREKWSQTLVCGRRLLKFLSGDGACRVKQGADHYPPFRTI